MTTAILSLTSALGLLLALVAVHASPVASPDTVAEEAEPCRRLAYSQSMPQVRDSVAAASSRLGDPNGSQSVSRNYFQPVSISGPVHRRRFSRGAPSPEISRPDPGLLQQAAAGLFRRSNTFTSCVKDDITAPEDSFLVDETRDSLLKSLETDLPNAFVDSDGQKIGKIRAIVRNVQAGTECVLAGLCRLVRNPGAPEQESLAASKDAIWAKMTVETVIAQLQVNPDRGLTSDQVSLRQADVGRNVLDKPQLPSFLEIFWNAFNTAVVYLMCIGSVVQVAFKEYVEAGAMASALTTVLGFGTIPEWRLTRAVANMAVEPPTDVQVLRDGDWTTLKADDLVPGDLVRLEAGDFIPADCRVVTQDDLKVNEATLTGESEMLPKDADLKEQPVASGTFANMLLMGTTVGEGRCTAVVVATGMRARYGSIQALLNRVTQSQNPILKKIDRLVLQLTMVVCGCAAGLAVLCLATGRKPNPASQEGILLQSFMLAVALCIAVIPEGLPIAVTLSLCVGMGLMLNQANARVRTLSAVQCLSAVDVFCSDKTGTLTTGQMEVVGMYAAGHADSILHADDPAAERIATIGAVCNSATMPKSDDGQAAGTSFCGQPTDVALARLRPDLLGDAIPKRKVNPFDSNRKMMSVVVAVIATVIALFPTASDDVPAPEFLALVKGAPERILERCTDMVDADGTTVPIDRRTLHDRVAQLSRQGNRVLALAYRPVARGEFAAGAIESGLTFAGLVAICDPLRAQVPGAVDKLHRAGIAVKMITGDSLETATAIAAQAHIRLVDADAGAINCAELRRRRRAVDFLRFQHVLGRYSRAPDYVANVPDWRKRQIEAQLGGRSLEAITQALEEAEGDLDHLVSSTAVFARALPEDKVTIVEALQRQGRIVAMTGDGVNDAPALKKADAGIAVVGATELTRRASPINLRQDNFEQVVELIAIGRLVADNMVKAVFCMFAANVGELGPFFGQPFGLPSPLRMLQVLWLNAFTDIFNIVPFARDGAFRNMMLDAPVPVTAPILNRAHWAQIVAINALTTIGALFIQMYTLRSLTGSLLGNVPDRRADYAVRAFGVSSTCVMLFMVVSQLLLSYTCRDLNNSMVGRMFFTNRSMHMAVVVSGAISIVVPYIPSVSSFFSMTPVPLQYAVTALATSLLLPLGHEVLKLGVRWFKRARGTCCDPESPLPSSSSVQLHEIDGNTDAPLSPNHIPSA